MKGKLKLSVVIPCKNEANSIVGTIKSIPSYVDEIIVVDNGSTDSTVEAAKNAGAFVLSDNRKLGGIGYGFAIMTGLSAASGDYVFTIDADGSHPANKINAVLQFMLKNNLDVVSCNRLPLSSDEAISKIRKLGIHILNLEAFLLFGVKTKDMLSGMFGIKKTTIKKLGLKMGDWNLSPEIKISAATNKSLMFGEFAIAQNPRTAGESKQIVWDTGTTHFLYILKRRLSFAAKLFGVFSDLKKRPAITKSF